MSDDIHPSDLDPEDYLAPEEIAELDAKADFEALADTESYIAHDYNRPLTEVRSQAKALAEAGERDEATVLIAQHVADQLTHLFHLTQIGDLHNNVVRLGDLHGLVRQTLDEARRSLRNAERRIEGHRVEDRIKGRQ